MDCVGEANKILRHYNDLQQAEENLNKRISRLVAQAGPRDLTAVDIEDAIKAAGAKDTTLNIIFELKQLTDARDRTRAELDRIDSILAAMVEEKDCLFYTPVLRAWYIDLVPKDQIARTIGYSSKRSIYTIKNQALRKFACKMFGIKALEAL